jgi:hypothetical protein
MVRRSTAAKKLDERRFPVRVRIKTPLPLGFGRKLDEMHSWLKERAGLGGYAAHGFNEPGMPDASVWYFNDVEVAREFVARFGCEALIVESR